MVVSDHAVRWYTTSCFQCIRSLSKSVRSSPGLNDRPIFIIELRTNMKIVQRLVALVFMLFGVAVGAADRQNLEGKPAPALDASVWFGPKPPSIASLHGKPVPSIGDFICEAELRREVGF